MSSGIVDPTIILTLTPGPHRSTEAEMGRTDCTLDVGVLGISFGTVPIGRLFPEWVPVNDINPATLEGEVVERAGPYPGPNVSFEDFPTAHFTHDFNFAVRPDRTTDNRFINLLGFQVRDVVTTDPCAVDRARLQTLQSQLASIQTGIPASKLDQNPGLVDIVNERINRFHVQHDQEMDQLRNRLNSPQCQLQTVTVEQQQELIEIEWETGLAASNDSNRLAPANRAGNSGGFYSAGHRRGEIIWNWPTLGDRVHIVGQWQFDRGHPPAETEIHPPRLVAVKRNLPTMTLRPVDPAGIEPKAPVLATRIDVFASGDGGALWNNRPDSPSFVQRIPMSDRDYVFTFSHSLPAPSATAQLQFAVERHNGDTFPGDVQIEQLFTAVNPGGEVTAAAALEPVVRITIPWNKLQATDDAVFARTIFLFWNEGIGVPQNFLPRVFRVTLDTVHVVKTQDEFDGEFRLFMEVGGNWMFENEFHGDSSSNILDQNLGDTGDNEDFPINRSFFVIVPPGKSFRVHAGGWEADGVNDAFGEILDPNTPCTDALKNRLRDSVFSLSVLTNGSKDDPIGEINKVFSAENGFGVGPHVDSSLGPLEKDAIDAQNTDPTDTYRLHYRIEEVSFPPPPR